MNKICANCYRLMSYAIVAVGLVEAVWGALQLFGMVSSGHLRYPVTGSFYNPGPYGCFIGAIFPIAVYLWLSARRVVGKLLPAAYVMMTALLLPGGLSRTGWLAALVGSAVVIVGIYREWFIRQPRRRLLTIGCVVGVGLAALAVGAYCLKPDSALGRWLMWKVGCRAVTFGGVGWEQVAGAYGDAQEGYFAFRLGSPREEMLAGSPAYVFNEYIQIAIAYGLPVGLLFAAAMIGAALLYWRRRLYGLCGVMGALMAVCMASYPLQFLEFRLLGAVVVAGGLLLLRPRWAAAAAAGSWVVAAGLFIATAKEVNIVDDFNKAKQLQKLERYEESNAILLELLPKTSDPMVLNLIGLNYQALGHPKWAKRCFRRSAWRVPNRVYPEYLLMNLYKEQNDTVFMRIQANEVRWKKPKVHSTAIEQMRREARHLLDSVPPKRPKYNYIR